MRNLAWKRNSKKACHPIALKKLAAATSVRNRRFNIAPNGAMVYLKEERKLLLKLLQDSENLHKGGGWYKNRPNYRIIFDKFYGSLPNAVIRTRQGFRTFCFRLLHQQEGEQGGQE